MAFPKSIRWRLQLWLAFLLLCVLSGFGVTALQLHRMTRFAEIDAELEQRVNELQRAIGRPQPFGDRRPPPRFMDDPRRGPRRGRPGLPPPRGRPEPLPELASRVLPGETLALFAGGDSRGHYFVIWNRDGQTAQQSTNAPVELTIPPRLSDDIESRTRTRGTFREMFHFTEPGDCMLVGRDIAAELDGMQRYTGWLFAAGGAVLALGLGGGWRLATRALKPVEDISVAANRIAAGNLAERISVSETDDELGRLAGVLNSTFSRLEAVFAQQRQFTADASHELRTPLAVLISETQTTLARERTAEEYREAVETCLETAQQMRRLSESLLEIARFDVGQEMLCREPVDLAGEARHCAELLKTIAAELGVEIECDLAPTVCTGDPARIRQVITNLIANAIHHNRENGRVRVVTSQEDDSGCVSISDTGPGIADEDLPHIFERFYRADRARGRASGRSGLGLAICRSIVSAHGGLIEVTSQQGTGTTFAVRLPIAPDLGANPESV